MAFVIKCIDHEQGTKALQVLSESLRNSRFVLSGSFGRRRGGIDLVYTGRRYQIEIRGVRLREGKDYCGQHGGPCQVPFGGPRPHKKSKCLEGLDWVSFNDMINDALDSIGHDGNVASSVCIIRKGRKRRMMYDCGGDGDWDKDTDDEFYTDNCGMPPIISAHTEGTPGILGYK